MDIKMGSGDDKFYKAFYFGLGVGGGVQVGNLQVVLGYQFGLTDLVNPNWVESLPIMVEVENKVKTPVFH
jgi:hypothetical protein